MYMLYLEATLDNNNTTSLVHVQYLEAISVEIGIGRNASYTVLNFHLQRVSTIFFLTNVAEPLITVAINSLRILPTDAHQGGQSAHHCQATAPHQIV